MGHREDLLDGAKRCLLEKGWVRTTAREIVAASGANLASIGYHYGSKEALMLEAFMRLTEEWGEGVGRSLAENAAEAPSREDRVAHVVDALVASFGDSRDFWSVQLEVMGQLGNHPELRERFAAVLPQGREGMTAIFEGVDDKDVPERASRTAGAVYHALFIGLWVQWLIKPEAAPDGRDVVEGMRRILAGTVLEPGEPGESRDDAPTAK
ncbi:TetR family transcriptional regulator [Streptomyces mashuensis]|uniref:TetR family transcriptional regulator n=1 Tax=Streptomyces mashuensis TaxID=33904 RepID=A0A919EDJ3_9ACTN|nr:TetR/AcrR family transcriptional regulator [Streptomyces mashuensis]GHF49845.1 TetR family transcriptional regulator [Streptomyces mashuensis]